MLERAKQIFFLILGHVFLVLGIIGAFLPILPTTPFALLAAACYARGSERLHAWLLRTRGLGPVIRGWEEHGVIGRRAKLSATVAIVALFSLSIALLHTHLALRLALAAIGLGILAFIWSRPSQPPDADRERADRRPPPAR